MSLMGYRSTLLGSVIALTLFYGGGSVIAFYALGPDTLQAWLEARGLWSPDEDGKITPINAAGVATGVVLARADAVWPWLLGGMVLGTVIVMLLVAYGLARRKVREVSRGEYRGMSLTITTIPEPDGVCGKPVTAELAGEVPKHHLPLIEQLLGYLQAHPDAFCGDGHSTTLLDHHLGVIDQAFEYEGADPLLPLAAAAHDIGKTVSHAKQNGQWVMKEYHDKAGGRLLPKFSAWWDLPEVERSVLLLAVKYEHSPNLMPKTFPGLESDDVRRAGKLLQQLREIDGLATKGEKSKVLENIDVEELAIETFLRVIPQVPYQVKGLAKGIKAAGFRVGDRLYLSEHHVREAALAKVDDDVAAALGGDYRARGEAGQFTQVLLKALEKRGWLVTELEGKPSEEAEATSWSLPADRALWRVQSGIIEFRGMMAVVLPEEHHGLYPKPTAYEVTVLGPQGRQKGKAGVTPTQGSGKRVERTSAGSGILAAEVCEISLFSAAPAAADTGGDVAVVPADDTPPWLLDGDPSTGGDVAEASPPATAEIGGDVAEAPADDTAWLLEDGPGATGGDNAEASPPAAAEIGGDVAEAPADDAAWLLEDGPCATGGDVAEASPPATAEIGGDVAEASPPATAEIGGDVAEASPPAAAEIGGDVAEASPPAAAEIGGDAAEAPADDAAWLLEDGPGATGGDVAEASPPAPAGIGGDAAEEQVESLPGEGGGQVSAPAEEKMSPIQRRLEKRRKGASKKPRKSQAPKAQVSGTPKLFS